MTGVCAYNDETELAGASREAGLSVPGQLAVIGCDDLSAARLAAPPLSTVIFDLEAAGRQAARTVLQSLDGRAAEAPPEVSDPRLLIRSSG